MNKKEKPLCLHILSSPFDGFYMMRRRHAYKTSFVVGIYIAYVLLQIISYLATGYLVNENDQSKFNALKITLTALLPFLLFVVANYSTTTLGDGKGFMKDIINVIAYSLLPLIVCHVIAFFISFVIKEESIVFYQIFIVGGWVVFAFYAFIGLIVIHEYTFTQGVLYLLFTVVAMAIIIFILILLLTLFQQLLGFITSIYREFIMRR